MDLLVSQCRVRGPKACPGGAGREPGPGSVCRPGNFWGRSGPTAQREGAWRTAAQPKTKRRERYGRGWPGKAVPKPLDTLLCSEVDLAWGFRCSRIRQT